MVTGTTSNPTNAKTKTNAKKQTRIIAPQMPLVKTPRVVLPAHVILDSRVTVSLVFLPTVNIKFRNGPAGLNRDDF